MTHTVSPAAKSAPPPDKLPKYIRLAAHLDTHFVRSGKPHDVLPTERNLQEYFGVSRDTVRRAIGVLQQRGLVYNVQGSGTYIADRFANVKEPQLISFTQDMQARGMRPSTATLTCQMVAANVQVARDLGLTEGAQVIEIVRLRRADGAPIAYETAHFLPAAFAHVAPETSTSLDAQLTRSGFRIEKSVQRIAATNLTATEAKYLAVPQAAAALVVERVGYTARGQAVESTSTLYRADRYDYLIELIPVTSNQFR